MIPIKENELKERLISKPESLSSGYTIGGEELLLPSGAISVFAAPTSHGKTTFLINLALNIATASPDKETYLFSYEAVSYTHLQDKGETDKALELLDSKVKEVKLKDKATEFSSLMIPIKENELKERQANKPESLNSGYTIGCLLYTSRCV